MVVENITVATAKLTEQFSRDPNTCSDHTRTHPYALVRWLLFLKATTKTMVATITGGRVRTKDKTNPMEVHEQIQLAIGIKTCPVKVVRTKAEGKCTGDTDLESPQRCA